jgi:hypothetical protein
LVPASFVAAFHARASIFKEANVGNLRVPKHCRENKADLDFRLIEPTSVLGSVVNRESLPEVGAGDLPVIVGKGFPAVDVQVIHDEVDCFRRWSPRRVSKEEDPAVW